MLLLQATSYLCNKRHRYCHQVFAEQKAGDYLLFLKAFVTNEISCVENTFHINRINCPTKAHMKLHEIEMSFCNS